MPSITLIEDDPAVNEALCMVLERSGYVVTPILDDRDFRLDASPLPDLYIIDRHLMGIDGLELCRHIKSLPGLMHLPVIVISASPDIHPLATAAGADMFIEKPFSKRQLLNSVEELLMNTH